MCFAHSTGLINACRLNDECINEESIVGMNESRDSQVKCLEKQGQSTFIEEGKKIILKTQNHVTNGKGLQLTQDTVGEHTAVLVSGA